MTYIREQRNGWLLLQRRSFLLAIKCPLSGLMSQKKTSLSEVVILGELFLMEGSYENTSSGHDR